MVKSLAFAVVVLWSTPVPAETVDVKYRGAVDLKPFTCSDITRSSFIKRVCYDKANQYMIIRLNHTYYHYCELPPSTLDALMAAESMGRYFNSTIKGSGKDGPFDCRTRRLPSYE